MSEIIADACALVAFHAVGGPGRIGAEGHAAMASATVLVASFTVWEIVRKVGIGKLTMPMPPESDLDYPTWLASKGYLIAPFDWQDAATAATLPDHHRDPWDRALIAIALRRNLAIITLDPIFRLYGVRTLW